MNILHVAPITLSKSSGISAVIPELINYQNKLEGVNSALLNITKPKNQISFNFKYFELDKIKPFRLKKLPRPFNDIDIAVIHSVYNIKHLKIIKELNKYDIPYILFPHGSMMVGAQRRKPIKKAIGNILFFNKLINKADTIQYLSEGEAINTFRKGLPHFILGNGIRIPKLNRLNSSRMNSSFNINFIGRLDIDNKGIDLILKTAQLGKDFFIKNNCIINLYGPDQQGSVKEIDEWIKKENLSKIVKNHKPVFANEKEQVLLDSDIFIQLSRHEGLPTGVLEALSYGIPCLLTKGTNLSEDVEKNKCGWEVSYNPSEIIEDLRFIIKNISHYDKYSENGIKFIENNYSWDYIAGKSIENYYSVIKSSKKN